MNRVNDFILDWFNYKTNKYNTIKKELHLLLEEEKKLKSKHLKNVEKISDLHSQEFKDFFNKVIIESKKIEQEIKDKKEELEKNTIYLNRYFIEAKDIDTLFTQLDYFDCLIKIDYDLKGVIMLIFEEINEYAKFTIERKKYNKNVNLQSINRNYEKKIKIIDDLLSELPPLLGGFNMVFESSIYSKEDLELRDNLIEYKKKLEDNKSKSKHKDNEYYRMRMRLIMNGIHKIYGIDKHKKDIDNFIKALRPALFELK